MGRVYIRPVELGDGDDLIRMNLAARAYHAPWVHPFTDRAGFAGWFEGLGDANIGFVARAVATGAVVGVMNFSQIFRRNFENAYLGFYGAVDCAGQGMMTEAVRLAVAYAFNEVGLHRLEANIQPGNLRSAALVRRVGFRQEGFSPRYLRIDGVWRDHERWALLADDPAAENLRIMG
jgi:ribosomal-protein-alanine N-acetyltransferase